MDPEKQPLLSPVSPNLRRREHSSRALSYEEVAHYRQEITWSKARFFLLILFWSVIAMVLSVITCLLISEPKCNVVDKALDGSPSIPPVHLTLAHLVSFGRAAE